MRIDTHFYRYAIKYEAPHGSVLDRGVKHGVVEARTEAGAVVAMVREVEAGENALVLDLEAETTRYVVVTF